MMPGQGGDSVGRYLIDRETTATHFEVTRK